MAPGSAVIRPAGMRGVCASHCVTSVPCGITTVTPSLLAYHVEVSMQDRRDEFLVEMYRQMMNDINRHIMVVWQSVSVLVGALAFFALVEKNIVSLDTAAAIVLMLCGWLYCHLVDASFWYNRNLVIIANIERQFLRQTDLREIHPYFGQHRGSKAITHLRLQGYLAYGLGALVLLWHFGERVWPNLLIANAVFDPPRSLPYLVAIAAAVIGRKEVLKAREKYKTFLSNSPGIDVDSRDIDYSVGHGQRKA